MPKTNTLQTWTLDRIVTQLPQLGRFDQREPLDALSDQREALCQALRQALLTSEGQAQLNAAVMLLKLQDQAGRDVFLRALRGGDAGAKSAMDFGLAPHDIAIQRRRPAHYIGGCLKNFGTLICANRSKPL